MRHTFSFHDLSIRRKLTLIIMITTCTAILLACGTFFGFDIHVLRESKVHDLQTLAHVLGSNSTAALTFNDAAAAAEVLKSLSAKEHIMAAALYRGDASIFATYVRGGGGSGFVFPAAESDRTRFEPGRLIDFETISLDGHKIGTIFLASDLREFDELRSVYSILSGLIVLSLSLGAFFLAAGMQRAISDPILMLAQTTRQVTTARDYSLRALPGANDETGILINGFNEMLSEIQRRDRALQQAREELELRVEQRTVELRQEIAVRKQTESALRESEQRARLLLDSTAEAIYGLDLLGQCTFLNRAALRLLGYSESSELLGRNMHDVAHHSRPDGSHYPVNECPIYETLRHSTACHREAEVMWRSDGSMFPAEYWSYPVERDGQVVGAVVTLIDISARRATEEAILMAKEAAESANRAKSEFLANVSHEIRTPMNGIIGMTELALDTPLNQEQREYLQLVRSSADSLLRVINDVLDFSKIEAGRLDLDQMDFDLPEVVNQTLKTLAVRAHKKGLELSCRIAPDVPQMFSGDPDRVRQILVNLVGNAIKFTPKGSVIVDVARHADNAETEPFRLHLVVRDTGIGIPSNKQQIIFEAFSQADGSTTREYGGTGLGLTITKRLVEMMGGKIWVQSQLGEGSTFHFTLKLGPPQQGTSAPNAARAELESLHVLIVDDNETNRLILDEMLKNWRMMPTLAESGEAALMAMRWARDRGDSFPLVLLDGHMPGMDGFEVARRIKADPTLAGATIMMLTSDRQAGDAARCRELGIKVYLVKPIGQSDLLDGILNALGAQILDLGTSALDQEQKVTRRLRLLLAEDNPVNARLTLILLRKWGHHVVTASNGREALDLLEAAGFSGFDAILMDVQMPEMDGMEATAAIRAREREFGIHLPIIGVTAHAMKGDRERCLKAGIDGYVSKPIRPASLASELMRVVADAMPKEMKPASVPKESAARRNVEPAGPLDRRALLDRVEGDMQLLDDIVALFKEDSVRQLAAIQEAVEKKEPESLRRAAHTLKGACANLGASKAAATALELERAAAVGDLSRAHESLQVLEAQVQQAQKLLDVLKQECV
jgi:two-component system, sensor histidine kinase and response regulator